MTGKSILYLVMAGVLAAGGCQHSVRPVAPPVDVPEAFSQSLGGEAVLPARWWEAFGDERLNALMERVLAENLQLRQAWDRLAQAEALAVQAGAALWPDATLAAGVGRTWQESAGRYAETSRYTLGAGIGYELDVWGRIRAARTAAELDVAVSAAEVQATALVLAGTAARTWYLLAEAEAQRDVLRRQIETNEQVLEVIKNRFGQGQVGAADVWRQQQLVAATRSGLIRVEESAELLRNALAVLAGVAPGDMALAKAELPSLPSKPEVGPTADVLQRRPDVTSALLVVQAADQRLAAAITNQYPRISLSADVETSGAKVRDLFDNWLANLAGNLVQPVFDAGSRKAEVDRRRALVSQALNAYGQTLLEALQDVEDALAQEQRQGEYLISLTEQLSLAKKVLERTQESYLKRQFDYLRVLEALVSVQSLERSIITAQRELLSRRIDLYQALAGGWEMDRPELKPLENHKQHQEI